MAEPYPTDPIELTHRLLYPDLRDALLGVLKSQLRDKGWADLTEGEQRQVADVMEGEARRILVDGVRLLAAQAMPMLPLVLAGFQAKKRGRVEVKLVGSAEPEDMLRLSRLSEMEVPLVLTTSGHFLAEYRKPEIDKDQPDLMDGQDGTTQAADDVDRELAIEGEIDLQGFGEGPDGEGGPEPGPERPRWARGRPRQTPTAAEEAAFGELAH